MKSKPLNPVESAIIPCCIAGILFAFSTEYLKSQETDYRKDVVFALDEIESKCGHFFKSKSIDCAGTQTRKPREMAGVQVDDFDVGIAGSTAEV